jgi:hypothetical protein
MYRILILGLLAISLSGCAFDFDQAQKSQATLLSGAGPDIDADLAKAYVAKQDQYLVAFAEGGGVSVPVTDNKPDFSGLTADGWKQVTNAGVVYISGQCENYLHEIWALNRARQATGTEITSLGTLAAAVLGVTKASSPAIAITASAFGFATATSENFYSSLLYQLEPSGVDTLVHNSEDTVKATIKLSEDNSGNKDSAGKVVPAWSRNDAVGSLRLYLNTCLPQSIEAGVNSAVKNAGVTVPPTPVPAVQPGAQQGQQPNAQSLALVPNTSGALGATGVQVNGPPPPPSTH